MTINIISSSETKSFKLESLITPARQVIWIGQKSDAVYNTITVDSDDIFLCTISYDKGEGTWMLSSGQVRTHCSRGLKSDRSKACSVCRGCCGYIRTANPDYSLRQPKGKVVINGSPLSEGGIVLNEGDTISFE